MSFYLDVPRLFSGGFLHHDRVHNLLRDLSPWGFIMTINGGTC